MDGSIGFLEDLAFGSGPPSGLSSSSTSSSLSSSSSSLSGSVSSEGLGSTSSSGTWSSGSSGSWEEVEEKVSKGWRARHPVVLVPGWCSSSLEVWKSPIPDWPGSTVWVSLAKLGLVPKALQEVKDILKNVASKILPSKHDHHSLSTTRDWLEHMCLGEDGYSDPEGIMVRPKEGIDALSYLCCDLKATQDKSVIFGFLIHHLLQAGYDSSSLIPAPYDWRLSPQKMNKRDMYFWKLKGKIEIAVMQHQQRVVIVSHSMGCKVATYFLHWISLHHGQEWIDRHVEHLVCLGSPWIGAPKAVRSLITSDKQGLDYFLLDAEMLDFTRRQTSVPLMVPIDLEHWGPQRDFVSLKTKDGSFRPLSLPEAFSIADSEVTNEFMKEYEEDPLYLKVSPGRTIPLALAPPPVASLKCIYGVGTATEVNYFYKEKPHTIQAIPLRLTHPKNQHHPSNPLHFVGGIGFEKRSAEAESGDGTVPLASLRYAQSKWAEDSAFRSLLLSEGFVLPSISSFELPKVSHRGLLESPRMVDLILSWCCSPPADLSSSSSTSSLSGSSSSPPTPSSSTSVEFGHASPSDSSSSLSSS